MELFILALLWLVSAGVTGVVVSSVLRRRIRRRAKSRARREGPSPWCGQCGYSMWRARGRRCPECGGNLRDVGVEW